MGVYFIGGSMRTGTNLLQRILCGAPTAHERLEEAGFLTGMMENYVAQVGQHPQRTLQYFESMEAVHLFQRRQLLDFFSQVRRRHPEARDLILKKPELTRTFPELAQLLPEARFVVMIRDPRDTLASMISVGRKQAEAGKVSLLTRIGRDIPRLCAHFNSFYERLWPALTRPEIARRTFLMRYEDLVSEPARAVGDLARFTGLALSPDALADQGEKADTGPTPYRTELTGGEISAQRVARYKAELSREEQAQVTSALRELCVAFKYPLERGPEGADASLPA